MNFHRIKNIIQQDHTLAPDEWKGAVLFLCNDEHVIFIKRSDKMPSHGGQIAFIGGHKLAHEHDPWISAQREYTEETSLQSTDVEFLGYLPVIMTARLQPIVPVMAKLNMPLSDFLGNARSNGEWVQILAYSWKDLMKEDQWNYAWRNSFTQWPILFHTIKGRNYLPETPQSHLLWGATASMVWDFLRLYFKHKEEAY